MDLSLFGWRTNEDQVKRAFAVTAAHFVTEDYNELTSSDLWHDGFRLHDRSAGTTLEVHSLVELELGRQYVTGHGNSIVRIDAATAMHVIACGPDAGLRRTKVVEDFCTMWDLRDCADAHRFPTDL